MSQNDDLLIRMHNAETEIEELNRAIVKFKKDLEEEIYNVSSYLENIKEKQS